ncbi:kinase-like protein [Nadsonia fulvescens var. elongata DSM 6958]|uniref:non-specific serine/threonine protein kinase n=1 Tax=Nadsonia fulvescens var. elongata DSM 6958 TaxID=857566 RepID=A0A1E3PQJ2_9ASCO|nr:kinase-like protein [Nadsonia fulvescens var. elongata DSM 6958]
MSKFVEPSIDKTSSNKIVASQNDKIPNSKDSITESSSFTTGMKRAGEWGSVSRSQMAKDTHIERENSVLTDSQLIEERRQKRQAIIAKYANGICEVPISIHTATTAISSHNEKPSVRENELVNITTTAMDVQQKKKSKVYDSDSADDMFADSPSNSDSEVSMGKSNYTAIAKGRKLEEGMHANWDDEDGYYRTIVGELIKDRYLINATLGRGMFAEVVRATDNVTGETLAIKIIRNNDMMRKAAAKEIAILQKLQNNDPTDKMHIVRLKYTFDHKNHLCLVFENLSVNLREVIKKFGKDCGLNILAVKSYTQQILIGLLSLERSGVIHADLKPDNILVSENHSILKICDLGSAFDISETEIAPYLASRFYRAPELILGLKNINGIDMWSTGCTLYELYTGKIMFPGKSNNNMLKVIMEVRGKFNHKLLKKGEFGSQHFDSQFNFLSQEFDSLTGSPIVKTISINQPTKDLKTLLKGMEQPGPNSILLDSFIDLLDKMLNINPEKRITPQEALNHPFIRINTL